MQRLINNFIKYRFGDIGQWHNGEVTNEDAILVTEKGAEKLTKLGYDEKLLDS